MLNINYKDRRAIYEQIVDGVVDLIRRGVFVQGEQLPSVRSLAMELSLNPNTVQRAFSELEQKGIIYCVKGKGNFVADFKEIGAQEREALEQGMKELAKRAVWLGLSAEQWKQLAEQAWECSQPEHSEAVGSSGEEGGAEND